MAMAIGLMVWVESAASSSAQEMTCNCSVHRSQNAKVKQKSVGKPTSGVGTLGYGPPGLFPGFQGFGLGYHLGYGYGGSALGVGAEGGYPFYGGPGYPHPAPVLSRHLAIVPFCYFGGPGYPTPEHPNFFGEPGALVGDNPVVTFEPDPAVPIQENGYGPFHGALPYPESTFAPYSTMIGEYGTDNASTSNSARDSGPPASGALGMMFEPFSEAGRPPGLKITSVIPSGVAEKAGLRIGDVMVSINGYVTQKLTDPEWIILNASPDKVLKMNVRFAGDGKDHAVTAQLP
jgi:membrane-associated protease RseP (regulator of RpoE activity)